MNIKILAGAAIAAAMMTTTGCQVTPGTIRDQSKPLLPGRYSVVGDEVSATETQVYLLGFPVSDLRGSAGRRMYKQALSQAPGADALIEYTTDTKIVNLQFVMFQWFTLTGVPVKTTTGK
ncbi:MAG: hypothetical protein ILO34_07290 [Kiritimatiellae bacterium]|nr:hypothetical protein [Kiritimatiellia bacterium]